MSGFSVESRLGGEHDWQALVSGRLVAFVCTACGISSRRWEEDGKRQACTTRSEYRLVGPWLPEPPEVPA